MAASVNPHDSHRIVTHGVHIASAPPSGREAELEKAEKEALLATARLDAVIEGARDGIVRLSSDMKIQSWNRAAQSAFGFAANAVLEDFVELAVPVATREVFQSWLSHADREGTQGLRIEHDLLTQSGAKFPAECSVVQRNAVDDDVTLFVRDLTIPRQLEAELRHTQKLEAIGRLAGGMAHEINTPLQYLNDNVEFLDRAFKTLLTLTQAISTSVATLPIGDDARAGLTAMTKKAKLDFLSNAVPDAALQSRQGLEQIGKIVRAMKTLTKQGAGVSTAVDLRETVETTVVVAIAEWKDAIDVEMSFDETLPEVACVPGEVGQVVLALVVNAAQAIEEKKTKEGSTRRGCVRVSMRREDEWAVLRVADDGCGIHPEHVDRVFDPFFTTKDVGKGMGQGLAVAHTIIERHHGCIEIDSTVGEGSTFTIKLPLG